MFQIFVDWILTSPHFEGTGGCFPLLPPLSSILPSIKGTKLHQYAASYETEEDARQAVMTITHGNDNTTLGAVWSHETESFRTDEIGAKLQINQR